MDALVVGAEVFEGVLRDGGEVIVAAEDEEAGSREQSAEGLDDGGDGFGVGEVVAGVDDESRGSRRCSSSRSHCCLSRWLGIM